MKKQHKKSLYDYLKLFSGRVFLTIFCGISFILLTHTLCTILLQKSNDITIDNLNGITNSILIIVSNVITFYFTRTIDNQNQIENKCENKK